MIVYLETSILLRRLFRQIHPIKQWGSWEEAYTSELSRIEALRTIDRFRLQNKMGDEEVAYAVKGLEDILKEIDEIRISPSVLHKASQAHPTIIGTLDAIHLASAYLWQEDYQKEILFLSHDVQLGRAALALGMNATGFHK